MHKPLSLFFLCHALASTSFAQLGVLDVEVNLNVRHEVGGISSFDREKFIVLHAGLTDNDWDSDAQRAQFLTDYDAYLGRNNGTLPWQLSQADEDPGQSGWVDHADLASDGATSKANYAADTAAHVFENRANKMLIGGQMSMYPNGQINGNGFAIADDNALADYYEYYLTYFSGTGGATGPNKPAMVEVLNEPFVAAGTYGVTKNQIAQTHNVVATRIKASHPNVLVGGYSAAHPQYEQSNFSHWNSNWKMFMDVAGANMDFWGVHLYDNPEVETGDPLDIYRSGSNAEAIMDMIEHYSYLSFGTVKPFNISEYGALSVNNDVPYAKVNDMPDLAAWSKFMMQFMERPNNIIQAIPFAILKAEWGRNQTSGNPYGTRVLRQAFEVPPATGTNWVYTELVKFYELWSEVNGTRVDTYCANPDIQVDAYVDGNTVYVILNNLDHTAARTIDLNLFGSGDMYLQDINIKHLYADPSSSEPVLDDTTVSGVTEVTLEKSATMILRYAFYNTLSIPETSSEAKYYATTYLRTINAASPMAFNINGVSATAGDGEAVLRVGVGRDHGLSLQPTVLVNGTPVTVPTNWRGYDQSSRDQFFGVLEIPVPYSLIQTNNTVSVEFADAGGKISSLALQVFEFSKVVERGKAPYVPINSNAYGPSGMELFVTGGAPNGYFSVETTTDLTSIWSVWQTGLPLDGTGAGSVIHPATEPEMYFRLREYEAPAFPLTGISLYPSSDTVGIGGIHQSLAIFSPENATNQSLTWISQNPSVASVAPDGRVTGIGTGSTTITATSVEGGYTDNYSITVGSSTGAILFDDVNNYKNQSFTAGTSMKVTCNYDVGTGYEVVASDGGIHYWLRELTSGWAVVNDYHAYDASAIGTQSGGSSGSIDLPVNLTPTANLPAGNFYFLFITLDSDQPGENINKGTQPIIIVAP